MENILNRYINSFQKDGKSDKEAVEENLSDADKLRRSLANMMDLSNYNTVNQFGGDSNPSAGDDSGLLGNDGNYSGNDQIYDEDGNLKKLC